VSVLGMLGCHLRRALTCRKGGMLWRGRAVSGEGGCCLRRVFGGDVGW